MNNTQHAKGQSTNGTRKLEDMKMKRGFPDADSLVLWGGLILNFVLLAVVIRVAWHFISKWWQ